MVSHLWFLFIFFSFSGTYRFQSLASRTKKDTNKCCHICFHLCTNQQMTKQMHSKRHHESLPLYRQIFIKLGFVVWAWHAWILFCTMPNDIEPNKLCNINGSDCLPQALPKWLKILCRLRLSVCLTNFIVHRSGVPRMKKKSKPKKNRIAIKNSN